MSRSKKIYVLLGVLLVVCAATLGVSRYEAYKEEIKNSDEVILKLASEDVNSLKWEYESKETGKKESRPDFILPAGRFSLLRDRKPSVCEKTRNF